MGDVRQEEFMNTVISYSLWVAIVDLFLHIVQLAQYHCNVLYNTINLNI